MADQNTNVGNENDETANNPVLFGDDYDIDGSTIEAPRLLASAGSASYSVRQLERDCETLQKKWQLVERKLSTREQQVAELQEELDLIRKDRDALVTQKQSVEDDLEAARESADGSERRIVKLESKNTSLKKKIEDLDDYIKHRKGKWDGADDRIREYEDTIKGMARAIESHESALADKDRQRAALEESVADLQRQLADVSGRHGERESAHSELHELFKEQTDELRTLHAESADLKREIDRVRNKLERRDETIRTLRSDLDAQRANEQRIDADLKNEKAVLSELRTEYDARIAELKLALKNSEALEQQLRSDASEAADELASLQERFAELEIRANELDVMYLESESARESVEAELEAQREIVETLEHELDCKRGDLDVLDMSVDRLSSIGDSIRALDVQIDSRWDEPQPADDDLNEVFDGGDEIMIEPEALMDPATDKPEHVLVTDGSKLDKQVCYPLIGNSITVGRSHLSDIQIDSKYISRNHVRILIDGATAIVEDAGSTNGFRINGRRVSRHKLADGDALLLGKSTFRYEHVGT
ncbi:MAG: FHA domain-containing protein [Woeseiaceae bacterium]|nr:FHA domain-containing protein [Woeseiaceae bacterium]